MTREQELALTPRGAIRLDYPGRDEMIISLAREIQRNPDRELPLWLCSEVIDLSAGGAELDRDLLNAAIQVFGEG